ncbi:MAG: TetR/AcrR family transcriptional regulator [Anaerolineae bacterium]|nr:TetR/AcrR family transcriptional regulator [Anaerolineae bacterium]
MTDDLTPKAQQTRRHILDTALDLFATQGYDATTMREIAGAADCSLGLAYRYFASKEAMVLALYGRMAAETAEQIAALPGDMPIAARFHTVMGARLKAAVPYRAALGALFGAAANPNSGIIMSGATVGDARDVALESFRQLVREAADAPRNGKIEYLASLLYSLHFLTILFWLYDRSAHQRATGDLLDFMRDSLATLRPMLIIPLVSSSLARLAGIMAMVFGGDSSEP